MGPLRVRLLGAIFMCAGCASSASRSVAPASAPATATPRPGPPQSTMLADSGDVVAYELWRSVSSQPEMWATLQEADDAVARTLRAADENCNNNVGRPSGEWTFTDAGDRERRGASVEADGDDCGRAALLT